MADEEHQQGAFELDEDIEYLEADEAQPSTRPCPYEEPEEDGTQLMT